MDNFIPDGFNIIKDGKSLYGLNYDKGLSDTDKADILYLNKSFFCFFGTELNGEEHFINLFIDTHLSERDFSVLLNENNGDIDISGGSTAALKQAVYHFVSVTAKGKPCKNLTATKSINFNFIFERDKIDNSSLISYIPTERVTLLKGNDNGKIKTPAWVEDLVIVEIRPDMASIGGNFDKSFGLIDFYATLGVNGIWITPIYERGPGGNGYGNMGPHRVDPVFSGTQDNEEGWQSVRRFVDYAHEKGIYVFLDLITWGVMKNAPLTEKHPDWFFGEQWGNIGFNWDNSEFKKWFISVCVKNILTTGADGYRCDCEPNYAGYEVFDKIRTELAEHGKYVLIMSEDGCNRSSAFEFEQDGVLDYRNMNRGEYYENPINFFTDGQLSIVDSVKNGTGLGSSQLQENKEKAGTGKYYTNCISNHDFQKRDVHGDRTKIGYAAILAPFIPLWYMGDEFNCNTSNGVQYDIKVNYAEINHAENSFFTEDVKKYIRIKRKYPEIFSFWAENHRNSNICHVDVTGINSHESFARYAKNRAVIVVPSVSNGENFGKVAIPFSHCEIDGGSEYTVTDLMTDCVISKGSKAEIDGFSICLPYRYVGVYLIEKVK